MIGDNFLWFPDKNGPQISGETSDTSFAVKKALEISEFDFGLSAGEATEAKGGWSASAAGKAKFGAITMERRVDSASVPLYKACSQGSIFPTVMMAVRESGGSPLLYLQYIFRFCQITGVTWSGGTGEKRPKEKVTMTFKAMGMQYIQQLANGREGTKQQWSWNTVNQGVSTLKIDGIDDDTGYEVATPPITK